MKSNHGINDADKHLIIDPITRTIRNESRKAVLVRGDHNSECYTFEVPKEIDGHDMTKCNDVKVHYTNTDRISREESADVYEVSDVSVSADGTKVEFTWLIGRNATRYEGSLSFSVSFACIESDGTVSYAWNTVPLTITISKGIQNGDVVVEEFSDVLSQWDARIASLKDGESAYQIWLNQGNTGSEQDFLDSLEPVRGVDYWTPEDVAELQEIAAKTVICGEATGAELMLDNTSDNYLRGLTIYGKSWQNGTPSPDAPSEINSVGLGVVSRNLYSGEGWSFGRSKIVILDTPLPPGTYTISAVVTSTDTDSGNCLIGFLKGAGNDENASVTLARGERAYSKPVTIVVPVSHIRFNAGPTYDLSTGDTATFKDIQIEVGSQATPYEPYRRAEGEVSVEVSGKNLFGVVDGELTTTNTTETSIDGVITRTANAALDTTYLLSSQFFTDNELTLNLPAGSYVFRVHDLSYTTVNKPSGIYVEVVHDDGSVTKMSDGVATNLTSSGIISRVKCATLSMQKGQFVSFKAQIEKGSQATDYTPYVEPQTMTLATPTGLCGVGDARDEMDFVRGKLIRRVRLLNLSDVEEKISQQSTNSYGIVNFLVDISDYPVTDIPLTMCNRLPRQSTTAANTTTEGFYMSGTTRLYIRFNESRIATLDALKAWLVENPVWFVYVLETPTETDLTAEEINAYKALHTNYPTTAISNDSNAEMEVAYLTGAVQELGIKEMQDQINGQAYLPAQSTTLPATAGWYRIASIQGSKATLGRVSACVSQNNKYLAQTVVIDFGVDQDGGAAFNKAISYTGSNSYGRFTKIRVTTTDAGTSSYVELYWDGKSSCPVTVRVTDILGAPSVTSATNVAFTTGASAGRSNEYNIID